MVANKTPKATRKQAIALQAAILSSHGNTTAASSLARVRPRGEIGCRVSLATVDSEA